jgi:hypothetical protein
MTESVTPKAFKGLGKIQNTKEELTGINDRRPIPLVGSPWINSFFL